MRFVKILVKCERRKTVVLKTQRHLLFHIAHHKIRSFDQGSTIFQGLLLMSLTDGLVPMVKENLTQNLAIYHIYTKLKRINLNITPENIHYKLQYV